MAPDLNNMYASRPASQRLAKEEFEALRKLVHDAVDHYGDVSKRNTQANWNEASQKLEHDILYEWPLADAMTWGPLIAITNQQTPKRDPSKVYVPVFNGMKGVMLLFGMERIPCGTAVVPFDTSHDGVASVFGICEDDVHKEGRDVYVVLDPDEEYVVDFRPMNAPDTTVSLRFTGTEIFEHAVGSTEGATFQMEPPFYEAPSKKDDDFDFEM